MSAHEAAKPRSPFDVIAVALEEVGQETMLTLPEGHRFLALVREQTAGLIPIDEPGEYHVEAGAIMGDGRGLPCVIVVVDLKHVAAWMALDASIIERIIDRALLETERRRAAHVH